MARNRITKPATLRRLSALVGGPVLTALTRGGTGHRIDCLRADDLDAVWRVWPDGAVARDTRIRMLPPSQSEGQ